MWRLANSQFEFPGEVRRASTCDRTEIPNVNGAVQVAVNVSSYPQDLPGRQTAPCGAVSARTTFDLGLQDVRRCDPRRLGRPLITPPPPTPSVSVSRSLAPLFEMRGNF